MQAGGKFAPSAPALTQATGVHSMARADANPTTNLSSMIRDPFVRAAFEAADQGPRTCDASSTRQMLAAHIKPSALFTPRLNVCGFDPLTVRSFNVDDLNVALRTRAVHPLPRRF
jgi:hypothetical protein